jgi:hypothetical protein
LVYSLTTMSTAEAERFGIPADDRRDYVRVDKAKINVATRPHQSLQQIGLRASSFLPLRNRQFSPVGPYLAARRRSAVSAMSRIYRSAAHRKAGDRRRQAYPTADCTTLIEHCRKVLARLTDAKFRHSRSGAAAQAK